MTYEAYRTVFLYCAIACSVMLVVSVILFIVYDIPKVFNDLTGRGARKAIDKIRKQNESGGKKSYQSGVVNLERGKLTDKITHSGRLEGRKTSLYGTVTEKISTQKLGVMHDNGETEILSATQENIRPSVQADEALSIFCVLYEITYIHTDEVLES